MAVTIDQAVANAVAARLRARLADATVLARWPDGSKPLAAKTITVLAVPARDDTLLQPTQVGSENIHDEIPTRVTAGIVVDLTTALAALNDVKATWNAHAASTSAHQAADATNVITAAAALDLGTGVTLANEAKADVNAHVGSTTYHEAADALTAITAADAIDLGTLVTLTEQLRQRVNAHYVARVYLWRLRAAELPLQLDVWGTSFDERDDLLARLTPELDADATSALLDGGGPRTGLLVDVGDGWSGIADVTFGPPQRRDEPDAVRRAEFRAMLTGTADFMVTVKAQSARLARATFRANNYDADGGAVVTYTPAGPVESFT